MATHCERMSALHRSVCPVAIGRQNLCAVVDLTGELWGKSPEFEPYPLLAHLLDSYLTAGAVWDHWLRPGLRTHLARLLADGDQDRARHLVQLAAGLHDIGKANPVFQAQAANPRPLQWRPRVEAHLAGAGLDLVDPALRSLVQGPAGEAARRHEYVGYKTLAGSVPDLVRDVGANWLPHAVAGHHGRWINSGPDGQACVSRVTQGGWAAVQDHIRATIETAAGLSVTDATAVPAKHAGESVVLVTGLVVLADWLASQDNGCVAPGRDLIRRGITPGPGWVEARREDLTRLTVDTLGTYHAPADPAAKVLQGRPPRPLQQVMAARAAEPGLCMVAYPTGEGKTEAALLRHMGRDDEGLVFALPTRATTNAMQDRLSTVFAHTGNQVTLSHQLAAAHAVPTPGAAHTDDWYTTSVRRLVAPVTTATCDQVLAGALRGKHAALRLLALANHHVILDEVHTYDQYQTQLLAELLHWWGATGTRVTLLSATLPRWQQREFENAYRGRSTVHGPAMEYPSIRTITAPDNLAVTTPGHVSAPQPDLVTRVTLTDNATTAHIRWVQEQRAAHPGVHLLVVVNTIDRAVEITRALRLDQPAHPRLICLHSRMKASHRAALERELHQRTGPEGHGTAPVTLVATQVVEASLDVDFDLASTDLCPAPSLVQRAGRVWRFRDPARRLARFADNAPARRVMHVVTSTTDRDALPYLPPELARVRDHLTDHPVLKVPDSVQAFVDETAFDLADWDKYTHSEQDDTEVGHAMVRIEAAGHAKAELSRTVISPPRGTRHAHLVTLTGRDLTEDLMGTRFVDRPSGMYLLLDTAAQARPMSHSRTACISGLDTVIPAGGDVNELMKEAHAGTMRELGQNEWAPAAKMLTRMLPVSTTQLPAAELTYDPTLGLIPLEETT